MYREWDKMELMKVVKWLSDKYTSKESSSVTYETANMLMQAVLYCLEMNYRDEKKSLAQLKGGSVRLLYNRGYEQVVEMVHKAMEVYNQIIENFEDYGVQNYRDTILSGMPAFFVTYDPRFRPMDNILTLDYPLYTPIVGQSGIRHIYQYINVIQREQQFLAGFQREEVCSVLASVCPEYEELYLDNICQAMIRKN